MPKCVECENYLGDEKCLKPGDIAHHPEEDYYCADFQPKELNSKICSTEIEKFGHPDFYKLLNQMAELHSCKNHDYAGTKDPLKNLRACERLNLEPFLGVLVRLQDKWSRLEEFVNSGQLMVKNESVIDTLMDNAVYSLLAIILYKEQQKNENKPDS
jgi:hypothetical protein